MPRWKELPASLDQRVRQLIVQLRRLKDHSGLSLASLAAKTSYSRSSWERYFNGKQLPPRDAVEELARVCGADPTRLLVLHEVAAEAWTDAPGPAGEEEREEDAPVRDRPRRTVLVLAAAVVALSAALVVTLLTTRPWQDDDHGSHDAGVGNAQSPFVFMQGRARPCDIQRREGELRAGYSATHTTLMDLKSSGWEVLEAQCLLKYHGFDPGTPDGSYGERSKKAAKDFQKDRGLVVDGVVGPDTWGELRR
ncbi:helix-turn-helix domain-containing protein [Streptomyces sp. NPDC026206]|uniref:helix-turn-helix domain-containing protein n=1 Tax=Streptomyces sp. NPDC026206 TaxID=3157089 RepID=UPI003410039B